MARNLPNKKRKEIKKRKGVIFLSHQRRLPHVDANGSALPRVYRELVDIGEGRLEERAEMKPIQRGWPRETQTARVMRWVEALAQGRIVRTFAELRAR